MLELEKRWRNLLIIAGGILLLVIIYIFILSPLLFPRIANFDDGFAELQDIFLEYEIEIAPFDLSDLEYLTLANLTELKQDLSAFSQSLEALQPNGEINALKSLTKIYIAAAEYSTYDKKQLEKIDEIDALSFDDYCSNINLFNDRDSFESSKLDKLQQLINEINSLISNHPTEAGKVSIAEPDIDLAAFNEANEERRQTTAELEAVCGGA